MPYKAMFRKISSFLFLSTCIATLCLIIGCTTAKHKEEEQDFSFLKGEPAFNVPSSGAVFTKTLNYGHTALSKADHDLYYQDFKKSWSSGKKTSPYPYDEPYYSSHKEIAETEYACINELIDLEAIVLTHTIKSIINKKVFPIKNIDKIKARIAKITSRKASSPSLFFCQSSLFGIAIAAEEPFLEVAASGYTVDKHSMMKFVKTGEISDLKSKPLPHLAPPLDAAVVINELIKNKEFKKQQLHKLFNPKSFSD